MRLRRGTRQAAPVFMGVRGKELCEAHTNWMSHCLNKLKSRLWKRSSFAVGDSFTLADIFVTSIYRKAISHGVEKIQQYDSYVRALSDVAGYDISKLPSDIKI